MGAYPMQKYYKIMIKQTFSLKNSRKIPTVSVILTTSKQAAKKRNVIPNTTIRICKEEELQEKATKVKRKQHLQL